MAGCPQLSEIDWSQPWFASVARKGELLASYGPGPLCDGLNQLLTSGGETQPAGRVPPRLKVGSGKPVLFVPQDELPADAAYEAHVYDTGRIPTRDNLHDLFNGLVWFGFPRVKARLNAMQARAIDEAGGAGPTRGALRDAVTLFDENGVILACSNDELAMALRRFDWRTLFVDRRTATLVQTEAWVLGHGMLEKLVQPYKSITAHTLVVPVDDAYFRASHHQRRSTIDRMAADWLDNWPFFSARDLNPLPVLGMPGWWPENSNPRFYDDVSVFRPGRMRSSK